MLPFWFKKLIYKQKKQAEACPWPPLWRGRRADHFSPLTQRILAVNVMALVILVGSLLYLGQYKDRLIEAELKGLAMQARMSASAVAEGAVVLDRQERSILSPMLSRFMVRRLVEASRTRTRVYDMDDILIADSLILLDPAGKLQARELPPPGKFLLINEIVMPLFDMFDKIMGRRQFDAYPEKAEAEGIQYKIVEHARDGKLSAQVWGLPKGKFVLSVAAPIHRYKQILGVVLLTKTDSSIQEAVKSVRRDIMKIFAVTLLVTLLLSMYLARTIAGPLKTLAKAAEHVRHGQSQMVGPNGTSELLGQELIPDLSGRQDEIGDLSLALREMTSALAKRIGAIENFAADVAHEIKNPLTSLRSAVETAARIQDPDRQAKLMEVILDDVNRLDRLITDISKASRLDAELTRDHAAAVDVTSMLQTLVSFYDQDAYQDKEIADVVLDQDIQAGLFISGVESRLVQVVQNLIMNALSFAPAGTEVKVSAAMLEDGVVEVSVSDCGPGIPAAKLEAIFDRFYSERPKDEKFGTHSGLGLSISKQIIEAHNGRIWAENRVDEKGTIVGARFVLQFPPLSEA